MTPGRVDELKARLAGESEDVIGESTDQIKGEDGK